jgi:hypothetical protein
MLFDSKVRPAAVLGKEKVTEAGKVGLEAE